MSDEWANELLSMPFASKVSKNDFIVGGKNFVWGSSRETAPRGIKFAGVGAVIAQSFARNFFRNSICIGLPVLICPDCKTISEGDELSVEPILGEVKNITQDKTMQAEPLPEHIMNMIKAGGLIPFLEKTLK